MCIILDFMSKDPHKYYYFLFQYLDCVNMSGWLPGSRYCLLALCKNNTWLHYRIYFHSFPHRARFLGAMFGMLSGCWIPLVVEVYSCAAWSMWHALVWAVHHVEDCVSTLNMFKRCVSASFFSSDYRGSLSAGYGCTLNAEEEHICVTRWLLNP